MAFAENLSIELLAEFIKEIFLAVPRALDHWRFRRFFGPSALSGEKIFAVIDPYTNRLSKYGEPQGPLVSGSGTFLTRSIISEEKIETRYIKRFLGRKPDQWLIGEDDVLGINVVRVVTYISALFSKYLRKTKPIAVVTDEAVADKWDGTFICFGSSDSNIKTYDIENLSEQSFYRFEFGPNGVRRFNIGNKIFTINSLKDYGILMRIRNPRHSEHFLFICAGLGAWGTSGSAYYLFDHWKELYKKHRKSGEFCKAIEVDIGSDESARVVHSLTK